MDAKLKALKVADLKAVLAAAHVHVPAKATKPDLIARIQASPPALAAYATLYPPDDLLAPPEEVDWSVEQPDHAAEPEPAPPAAPVAPASASPPKPAPAPTTTATPADPTTDGTDPPAADVDPEVEKRRQRAARFGIPFVEPQPQAQPKKRAVKPTRAPSPAKAAVGIDPKKLEERAARFGIKPETAAPAADPASKSRKRIAPEADAEELARRKKRAERFGVPTKP